MKGMVPLGRSRVRAYLTYSTHVADLCLKERVRYEGVRERRGLNCNQCRILNVRCMFSRKLDRYECKVISRYSAHNTSHHVDRYTG